MTTGYLELVGVQVSFSNAVPLYCVLNYYRRTRIVEERPIIEMRGYDLDRVEPAKTIAEALRKAYAPATLVVWAKAAIDVTAEYLQFEADATPPDAGLEGVWLPMP